MGDFYKVPEDYHKQNPQAVTKLSTDLQAAFETSVKNNQLREALFYAQHMFRVIEEKLTATPAPAPAPDVVDDPKKTTATKKAAARPAEEETKAAE